MVADQAGQGALRDLGRRRAGLRRAVAKAASWQALGLVTSTLVAFALTGSLAAGGAFALATSAIGAVMFVLHEHLWERLDRRPAPSGRAIPKGL